MNKPLIIILPEKTTDGFEWLSGGWNMKHQRETAKAKELVAKASACIKAGSDRNDVIKRLENAGFDTRPATTDEAELTSDLSARGLI